MYNENEFCDDERPLTAFQMDEDTRPYTQAELDELDKELAA